MRSSSLYTFLLGFAYLVSSISTGPMPAQTPQHNARLVVGTQIESVKTSTKPNNAFTIITTVAAVETGKLATSTQKLPVSKSTCRPVSNGLSSRRRTCCSVSPEEIVITSAAAGLQSAWVLLIILITLATVAPAWDCDPSTTTQEPTKGCGAVHPTHTVTKTRDASTMTSYLTVTRHWPTSTHSTASQTSISTPTPTSSDASRATLPSTFALVISLVVSVVFGWSQDRQRARP